jgi:hypothetical protein
VSVSVGRRPAQADSTQRHPLPHRPQSTRDETIRAIRQLPPSFPEFMSPGLRDFITTALDKGPATRCSVADLVTHPWISATLRWGVGRAACSRGPAGTCSAPWRRRPRGGRRPAAHSRRRPARARRPASRAGLPMALPAPGPALEALELNQPLGLGLPPAALLPAGLATPQQAAHARVRRTAKRTGLTRCFSQRTFGGARAGEEGGVGDNSLRPLNTTFHPPVAPTLHPPTHP